MQTKSVSGEAGAGSCVEKQQLPNQRPAHMKKYNSLYALVLVKCRESGQSKQSALLVRAGDGYTFKRHGNDYEDIDLQLKYISYTQFGFMFEKLLEYL
jgi:hypothetical protein